MKEHVSALIEDAITSLKKQDIISKDLQAEIIIDNPKQADHGDVATNIALVLAKEAKIQPRKLAEEIVAALPKSMKIAKVEIAGPGFINFFFNISASYKIIEEIIKKKELFGKSDEGKNQTIIIEYVSANPTGPLHVGHGRSAAYGDSVANLLDCIGYDVHREYYVNDAGRQMDILTTSVWIRYLVLCGKTVTLPGNAYQGEYIIDIAKMAYDKYGESLACTEAEFAEGLPDSSSDEERFIDAIIDKCKTVTKDEYNRLHKISLDSILSDIKADLSEFRVNYDQWCSEKSVLERESLEDAIEHFRAVNPEIIFEENGATWFRSTLLGDDKDRVMVRNNGQATYFANDVLYHIDKIKRKFKKIIDVFGADHHSYIKRLSAAVETYCGDKEKLVFPLIQFVSLYRGDKKISMSTRSGSFVTLRQLREEIGSDAARYFYISKSIEQSLNFDLELAKSQNNTNPLYYIQYAHARISRVFKNFGEQSKELDLTLGLQNIHLLVQDEEKKLIAHLGLFKEKISDAANKRMPHLLATYLHELAKHLHAYYNAHQFIADDQALCNARLCLIMATKQLLANGLSLLGVSAPESMEHEE